MPLKITDPEAFHSHKHTHTNYTKTLGLFGLSLVQGPLSGTPVLSINLSSLPPAGWATGVIMDPSLSYRCLIKWPLLLFCCGQPQNADFPSLFYLHCPSLIDLYLSDLYLSCTSVVVVKPDHAFKTAMQSYHPCCRTPLSYKLVVFGDICSKSVGFVVVLPVK